MPFASCPASFGLLFLALLAGCGGEGAAPGAGSSGSSAAGSGAGVGSGTGGAGGGAGGAGGGAPACDRASATKTADVALFDELAAKIAASDDPGAEVDAFMAAVAASGGTPLTDLEGDRVIFLRRGAPSGELSVAGSWNDWAPGALPMVALGSTDLYVAEAALSTTQSFQYKLVDSGIFFEDRLAQNVVWDGIDHHDVGEMNGVVRPENGDPAKGRLRAWRGVHGVATGDDRDVFVYLPAAYDAPSCPVLPAIEFHDGNESLTRAPFQDAADETYAASPEAAAVLVFVALPSQDVRMAQYTFGPDTKGDDYVAFLRDDLRTVEVARLRLCAAPADRGIAGASLGGLISAYAAFQAPASWGYVGSQSGSFFWEDGVLVARAAADPVVGVRFYLDHGCPDDNCESNQDLHEALVSRGYEVEHVEEPGGQHDWTYWKKRLPELLRYFREGKAGCST